MNRRLVLILSLSVGMGVELGPLHGQEALREPFELVRSLQAMQDQIALGGSDAQPPQRTVLAQIGGQLAQAGPDVWKEPKNGRAAVAFVLSGGDPRILKKVLAHGALPGMEESLVQGALAYAEGRTAEAARLLGQVDARTLAPSLAGHIALVQSELVAKKDPAKALALLDLARLLSPGTLIEEAALRRQVSALAVAGDFDRFDVLSGSYLHRFGKSIYAGAFRRQFAIDLARREDAGSPNQTLRLQATLEELEPVGRRDFYLWIAREALVKGKVNLARFATRAAKDLSSRESVEARRATLYEASALVVTEDIDKAVSILEAMDQLEGEDAEFRRAALAVAGEVRRSPSPGGTSAGARPDDLAMMPKAVHTAQEAMARVDLLISKADR